LPSRSRVSSPSTHQWLRRRRRRRIK
jgi:hypothetical protein